jgi:DNA-binding XRE family transcriptional regulator
MVAPATLSGAELRATLGLSQAKFAQHLGVSRHTVIRTEKGRTVPSRLTQSAIARIGRREGLTSRTIPNLHIYRVNMPAMMRHLGPAKGWRTMKHRERGRSCRWRKFYRRIQAEQQGGQALVFPR